MTPNTRKPTVEEVGDWEPCWVFNNRPKCEVDTEWPPMWVEVYGLVARRDWDHEYTHWLPDSAIPDPNNTTKEQTT